MVFTQLSANISEKGQSEATWHWWQIIIIVKQTTTPPPRRTAGALFGAPAPAPDGTAAAVSEELGDLLFSCVNLSRHLGLDAETTLRRASAKFERRFRRLEQLAAGRHKDLEAMSETELAQKLGKVTGLVSDTRLTHATPAAFAAHQPHRSLENEIAVDMLEQRVDVMLSGGLRHWLPEVVNDKGELFVINMTIEEYRNKVHFSDISCKYSSIKFAYIHICKYFDFII